MWSKIREFFYTDVGEIILHVIIAILLALLIKVFLDATFFEIVFFVLLGAAFLIRELSQHEWKFTDMGRQSYLEFLFPWVAIILVFFL